MIDFIKQTPAEYSKMSRDYQVIARLYSSLLNVSKMYTDNMKVWKPDIDNELSVLRAQTLNFNPKHQWDTNSLEAITSCFKYLVRRKGTQKALEYCINILMKIEGLNKTENENIVKIKDNVVTIQLEERLASIGIIEDLVEYILPAGLLYRINQYRGVSIDDSLFITDLNVDASDISTNTYSEGDEIYIGSEGATIYDSFIYDHDNQIGG